MYAKRGGMGKVVILHTQSGGSWLAIYCPSCPGDLLPSADVGQVSPNMAQQFYYDAYLLPLRELFTRNRTCNPLLSSCFAK